MYYAVKAAFWVHLAVTVLLIAVNYFNTTAVFTGNNMQFTVRGHVGLTEKNWTVLSDPDKISIHTEPGISAKFLVHKRGFARVDYKDLSAIDGTAVWITLFDILILVTWLMLTYLLMKMVTSVYQHNTFRIINVRRMQLMGLILFVSPILQQLKSSLFARFISSKIDVHNHVLWSGEMRLLSYDILKGLCLMLLFLVLASIFRYGADLKEESELVI